VKKRIIMGIIGMLPFFYLFWDGVKDKPFSEIITGVSVSLLLIAGFAIWFFILVYAFVGVHPKTFWNRIK